MRPDGEVRYIRCVSAPIVNNQNRKEYIGSAIDVTEHELLTQELRRREAYLAEAQRLSHTGSFGWKPDGGEIVWSDETYRIFEYDHTVKPTIELLVQRVHPEDRPDFLKVIESASAGATQFEHIYRWLLPDGSVKHVHALARAFQDASGNREFVGAATDITERKTAEERIREQEAELRQILDLAPQHVTVFGPHRERLYANRILLDYPGISLDEWRQRPDSIEFLHPDDRERVRANADRALSGGAAYELEFRVRKSSGNYRWFLARFGPVRDDKGQVMRWYVTATDIEDRKRAEDALRRSEKELRQVIDVIPQQVVVFDSEWEPQFANRRELEYTGLTPQEAQSKDATARIFHPEDLKKLEVLRRRALSDGSSFELEARIRGKDGQYRWFLIRDNPLRDEQGRVVRWYRRQRDAL